MRRTAGLLFIVAAAVKKSAVLPSFYASGKIIADILKREGQIEAPPPIEATFDATFVNAVQAGPGAWQ